MGSFSTSFLEKTKEYVAGFIGEHFTEKICYHNIDHTIDVVGFCELIGNKCRISESDMEIVIIAAWFHDTGYYLGCQDHEDASAEIAEKYLSEQNCDTTHIKKVVNCILATKIPQTPKTLLEKILCDADLYHLSSEQFFEKSELLLQELKFENQDISDEMWLEGSKEFVEAHRYHTPYGKRVLFPRMLKNLKMLKSRIEKIHV